MMVYRRIANPYMPQGTPDKTNATVGASFTGSVSAGMYAPGELGCAFNDQNTGGTYLRVIMDSGATASTSIGVPATGQLAYWKDQANAIVTNDKNQCDAGPSGAINRVAGVVQLAVTPGNYCDLVIRKLAYPVATQSALIGAQATADTTANTARLVYTTGVNTAPVSQVVGVFASSTITNGLCPVDVALGFAE